ncbi:MAG: prepilin-type N-terminal cleavage/methylation domain-containing protein [Oscillospiraceae bacterium]|nr:prepilin-type N-terminal cleavage/methylation domain-containing protein [Oscillospiraceae bacterium]
MMKFQKTKNTRVKGFTLIELIIVIAIIGILAGILAPTMSTYYMKSRIKAANSNAKMVYNAAQTAVQKYISRDRTAIVTPTVDERSHFDGMILISYNGTDHSINWRTGYDAASTAAAADSPYATVADAVNRTVSNAENISWTVCVNNYIVQGCVAADNQNTDLVGYYSANRTFASERANTSYTSWVTTNAAVDSGESIKWVCDQY